jgi:transposase
MSVLPEPRDRSHDINVSETVTPWEFRVEGEQGSKADEHRRRALGGPEIEVVAKATRRRFTLDYKRKIVREADGCKTPGAVGALLRREGLYSSHLATWRAARDRGELVGLEKKRGPTPQIANPRDKKIAELEREAARWRKRAERAEALVEVQRKLGALLETPLDAEPS